MNHICLFRYSIDKFSVKAAFVAVLTSCRCRAIVVSLSCCCCLVAVIDSTRTREGLGTIGGGGWSANDFYRGVDE